MAPFANVELENLKKLLKEINIYLIITFKLYLHKLVALFHFPYPYDLANSLFLRSFWNNYTT